MERSWDFPEVGFAKINVFAVSYDHPLPNGNTTGVGVVIRDHQGRIIVMVSGTIGHVNARVSELWAFLLGLRAAFGEKEYKLELETESADALKEWEDWMWFIDRRHARVVQQLNQRLKDKNLVLIKREKTASQNGLVRYLAENGAATRVSPVRIYRPFGRVREIWHLDMDLGYAGDGFLLVDEEEYEAEQQQQQEWLMAEDQAISSSASGGGSPEIIILD